MCYLIDEHNSIQVGSMGGTSNAVEISLLTTTAASAAPEEVNSIRKRQRRKHAHPGQ